MAKISFEKGKTEGPTASAVEEPKQDQPAKEVAVEVAPENTEGGSDNQCRAVAAPAPAGDVAFYDEDDASLSEIKLPRLNIVQKVGPLSNDWDPGTILLSKELEIYTPDKKGNAKPVEITVLGFRRTQWTERVAGGALGRLFNSEEEVYDVGGTTNYKEWEASAPKPENRIPYFQRLATALVLIKRPEGIDENKAYFTFPFEGQDYAIAQWSMKGAAYTNGAQVFKTARKMGHLRTGYCVAAYHLGTRPETYGTGNTAIIPVLRPGGQHTAPFIEFAKSILGTPETPQGNVD